GVGEEEAGGEAGDVLFEGDVRIYFEEGAEGVDEDFGHVVVDCEDGVGDGVVFVFGVRGQDAVLVVVSARSIAELGVQAEAFVEAVAEGRVIFKRVCGVLLELSGWVVFVGQGFEVGEGEQGRGPDVGGVVTGYHGYDGTEFQD
ncbi:MAG: hypothetical protein Q9222_007849, partial [Ikaeria aurantiellina]